MSGTSLTPADVYAMTRNNNDGVDGFAGMGGIWGVIMLLIVAGIFGGGNGLFGGNRGNDGTGLLASVIASNNNSGLTRSDLFEGFNNQDVNAQLRGITNGLCDGFYALNNSVKDSAYATQTGINNLGYEMQNCCCGIKQEIMQNRFDAERNTCSIITNQNAGVQRILDKMCENETQALRDRLFKAELANSQAQQNATLIDTLRPCPIPAYATCNPWASNYGSCGCGNALY